MKYKGIKNLFQNFNGLQLLIYIAILFEFLFIFTGCNRSATTTSINEENILESSIRPSESPNNLPDFLLSPDIENQIVDAMITQTSLGRVWAVQMTAGSFTVPESQELLALVGGIPEKEGETIRWVIIGRDLNGWSIRGWSLPLETASLPGADVLNWLPPETFDFNHDGLEEVLVPYHEEQGGWKWNSARFFHWDHSQWKEQDWSVIVMQDNTAVSESDYPQPYRYIYKVIWSWEDLDGDSMDELILDEHVDYYNIGTVQNLLGEKEGKLVYRWNGSSFEPQSETFQPSLADQSAGAFYPWWNSTDLPEMIFAEYIGDDLPQIHFSFQDGKDVALPAENWKDNYEFQVIQNRVIYPGTILSLTGVELLQQPYLPGVVSTLASSDFSEIAWFFADPPAASSSGSFSLLLTDEILGQPRLVWTKMFEAGTEGNYSMLGWSHDNQYIYLSQPATAGAPLWNANPRIIAVQKDTGKEILLGDPVNIIDALVSPDDLILIQLEQLSGDENYELLLRQKSLENGIDQTIRKVQPGIYLGDFSFSPNSEWLVWQEKNPDGSFAIRGYNFVLQQTLEINRNLPIAAEPVKITGWVGNDKLVVCAGNGRAESYILSLSENPMFIPLSPYSYLGLQK